jgi:hypothetical protein
MHRSSLRGAFPGKTGRPIPRGALVAIAVLGILFATLLATAGAHHHEGGSFDQHCLVCQVAATYSGGAPSSGIPTLVDHAESAGSVAEQLPLLASAPHSRSLRPRAPPVA